MEKQRKRQVNFLLDEKDYACLKKKAKRMSVPHFVLQTLTKCGVFDDDETRPQRA